MRVSELIAELQKLPQDSTVIATNSRCCGCSPHPIGTIETADGEVFIDGDGAYEEGPKPQRDVRMIPLPMPEPKK